MHHGCHSPEAPEREGDRGKARQDMAMRSYPQLGHPGKICSSSVSLARPSNIVRCIICNLIFDLAALTDSWTLSLHQRPMQPLL